MPATLLFREPVSISPRLRQMMLGAMLAVPLALSISPAQSADGDRPGAEETQGAVPSRFGQRQPDDAYGAYQRGLYVTALQLAEPRAETGDAAAQVLLGEIYSRGLGTPKNDNEAAKWYGRAADQNVPEAQFQYALLLIDGKGVERDEAKARTLMEQAAESGHRLAQFNFAQMLLAGEVDPTPDALKRAVDFYEKAAAQNLADAQYAMSVVYADGVAGRAKDEATARDYLERAAKQGFDTAQVEFASWLVEGRGGPRDEKAGFAAMEKAAKAGNIAAQNRLAKLIVTGIGTESNPILAAAWYFRAREAGLVDPFMEDYLDGLTDEQLKAARGPSDAKVDAPAGLPSAATAPLMVPKASPATTTTPAAKAETPAPKK